MIAGKQSTTEWVVNQLGREIIQAERPGGARLQELTLARQMGVSRGSVREALLVLQRQQLIDILPRRGAVVREFNEDEIFEFSEIYTDLQKRLFRSLCRLPANVAEALSEVIEAKRQAVADGDRTAATFTTERFIEILSAFGRNHYLVTLVRTLAPVRLRLAFRASRNPNFDPQDDLRFHQALQQALRERDSERLDELIDAQARRERQLVTRCESTP